MISFELREVYEMMNDDRRSLGDRCEELGDVGPVRGSGWKPRSGDRGGENDD